MRTITQVLDTAKKAQKVQSDYKLALCIGIGETALANYRHGRSLPDEKACEKLAIAMGEDPIILMVEMQAQRTKDDKVRSMWERAAKRLQKGFASLSLMSLLAIVLIASTALPALATVYSVSVSVNSLYIMLSSRFKAAARYFAQFVINSKPKRLLWV